MSRPTTLLPFTSPLLASGSAESPDPLQTYGPNSVKGSHDVSDTGSDQERSPGIRIFLADDHITVVLGLKTIIDAQPDMRLVGYATDGRGALNKIDNLFKQQRPQPLQQQSSPIDVLVVDIGMPGMDGIETATQIRQKWPQIRILALSMHEDRSYLRALMEAGASGYVLKRSVTEVLIRAIRAVATGKRYIDPALSDAIADTLLPGRSSLRGEIGGAPLSRQEEAVMRLIAQGHTNKEVAAQLSVSVKTVETYKARSLEKLGLEGRADLMRHALAQGWLKVPE